jgi:hypothetical protein
MANYKLQIDDFDEIEYCLIAIHSNLDDYRLSYFINKNLPINLAKSQEDIHIQIKDGETSFTKFHFEDFENNISWNLIQNKNQMTVRKKVNQNLTNGSISLFENSFQENIINVYLLPEFKKVNYFLKIDNFENRINITEITAVLNTIERISTVYAIDLNNIKNKNNLIF